MKMLVVAARMAHDRVAAAISGVLKDAVHPRLGGALGQGFGAQGTLMPAVDEDILDVAAVEQVLEDDQHLLGVQLVSAHMAKAVQGLCGVLARVADVDVAPGAMRSVRVNLSADVEADIPDHQRSAVG